MPLPIPQPVAKGRPGAGFARPWSIYTWLAGEPAISERIVDLPRFATDLAEFLAAAPSGRRDRRPGGGRSQRFPRCPLRTYDVETCQAIEALGDDIDAGATATVWEAATLATEWERPTLWVHGDITANNLLVIDGRLSAVIDFGCAAVGDPAGDLVMAWTFFEGESRDAFRRRLLLDQATGARLALWKALITLVEHRNRPAVLGGLRSIHPLAAMVTAFRLGLDSASRNQPAPDRRS